MRAGADPGVADQRRPGPRGDRPEPGTSWPAPAAKASPAAAWPRGTTTVVGLREAREAWPVNRPARGRRRLDGHLDRPVGDRRRQRGGEQAPQGGPAAEPASADGRAPATDASHSLASSAARPSSRRHPPMRAGAGPPQWPADPAVAGLGERVEAVGGQARRPPRPAASARRTGRPAASAPRRCRRPAPGRAGGRRRSGSTPIIRAITHPGHVADSAHRPDPAPLGRAHLERLQPLAELAREPRQPMYRPARSRPGPRPAQPRPAGPVEHTGCPVRRPRVLTGVSSVRPDEQLHRAGAEEGVQTAPGRVADPLELRLGASGSSGGPTAASTKRHMA